MLSALIIVLITLPGVGLAALMTVALHGRYAARRKIGKVKQQRAIFVGGAAAGLLGVIGIQLDPEIDLTTGWAIAHGSFLIASFIAGFVTIIVYWLVVALVKKEPIHLPETTRGR